MTKGIATINIKSDLPTVEEARRRLVERLEVLAGQDVKVVKVIHGYGSTGKGGKIRNALRPTLRRLQREGLVRCFVPGEQWNNTNETARQLLKAHPHLARDPDLGKGNLGCTIIAILPRKRVSTGEGPSGVRAPADLEERFKSDAAPVYDLYSGPDMIRRFKPEP